VTGPRPTTTFDRVLDEVGSAVVSGADAPGSRRSIDDLVARTGASRSIVREAVRVLVALGLVRAGRRVGVVVQPADRWDVLDPRVVGWRLRGPDAAVAASELRALRRAVEPAAAAAAAGRAAAHPDDREALRTAADRLATAAAQDDRAAFAAADVALHERVLRLSGNALYARLHLVVGAVLLDRGDRRPDRADVALHVALARAVADGHEDAAAAAMREIVDRT
jgi:DNA-binding FadR family transcriptional regulator